MVKRRNRAFVVGVYMLLGNAAIVAHAEDAIVRQVARDLARDRQPGYERVGVLSSFVEKEGSGAHSSQTVSSVHGLYYAEQVQMALVEIAGDDFQVVASDILMNALRKRQADDLSDLTQLKAIAAGVGGLDAIVRGKYEIKTEYQQFPIAPNAF